MRTMEHENRTDESAEILECTAAAERVAAMTRAQKLDSLIRYLLPGAALPRREGDKWLMFRALVNQRAPGPVSEDFLCVQDSLLKDESAHKGITRPEDLPQFEGGIYLWRGDITALAADGIVNAANSGMTGCYYPCHGCIDNAIHTYAGVELRNTCAALMERQGYPEPTGQAKITPAFNLPCRYILHTVGPIIRGPLTDRDRRLLKNCYLSCLRLADGNHLTSLAFCCISTGEFHFPPVEAARIAVGTVREFLAGGSRMKVIFDVFKEDDLRIYEAALKEKN